MQVHEHDSKKKYDKLCVGVKFQFPSNLTQIKWFSCINIIAVFQIFQQIFRFEFENAVFTPSSLLISIREEYSNCARSEHISMHNEIHLAILTLI